eukprot:TRINITY_DN14370_c0_g1_i3.p3 TRINITY_DN14370_c0_g1~~TRINITY_DN14370_c0_g1_i3.p3  ORF type:complete len:101 (+),score=23.64 TRINITY_DN14370_c0_g1_i3:167-469(+)
MCIRDRDHLAIACAGEEVVGASRSNGLHLSGVPDGGARNLLPGIDVPGRDALVAPARVHDGAAPRLGFKAEHSVLIALELANRLLSVPCLLYTSPSPRDS